MPKRIFAVIVFGLSAVAFLYSDFELHRLVDAPSIFFISALGSIIFIAAWTGAAHWSESTLALGLPMGLLGGTIGVTSLSTSIDDYNAAYPATSILLLCVLYGGILSAIGYFGASVVEKQNKRLPKTGLIIALAPISFVVLMAVWDMDISTFFSLEAIGVFFAVFATQIIFSHRFSFQRVTEGTLFGAIVCLMLGLSLWYSSGELDRGAINLAINGLNYGLVIYIVVYVISLSQANKESDKIETGRANWHWMEVTAFMVFMLFAPETIRETLLREQSAVAEVEATELLEQRFTSLEQRILKIENQ